MNAPFLPGRGLQDPVLGSQAIFRAMLEALSRPGIPVQVPALGVEGPDALPAEVLTLLVSICDHDTPVWLEQALRASPLARWLAFHCNAPMTADPLQACFAVLHGPSAPSAMLDQFALGDVRYPERSTTVIFYCDDLTSGAPIALTGPGVEARLTIRPSGLPDDFVAMAQANHESFPRGVDVLLVAGSQMIGLPRSTKLEREAH
jgi:alpha-D-ribose 1-methylphosphonate 5-triphosphate synthase subunit PhnH